MSSLIVCQSGKYRNMTSALRIFKRMYVKTYGNDMNKKSLNIT